MTVTRSGMQEEDVFSLCQMMLGGQSMGIDTRKIREVLGARSIQRVPLAQPGIAGVISYRGDVLTAVDLRELFALESGEGERSVLVIEGEERFAVAVDSVGGVASVRQKDREPNPDTLPTRSKALFDGAFKVEERLIVQLDPERLRPSRLAESGLLTSARRGENECTR